VCSRDRVKGDVGYSMDQLIALCTKLAREVDKHGMHKMLAVGDKYAPRRSQRDRRSRGRHSVAVGSHGGRMQAG
jgi:hypothetical protein